MFFASRKSSFDIEALHWQHELLRDYIMDLIDCTVEQADQLIRLREQLEMNGEMIERQQERHRLAFARYLVEHKHLSEELLDC